MTADRFEGRPLAFDPEHPDLGWTISEPLPYYEQAKPRLLVRVLVLTLLRRYRCQARWWCSWPATEQGGTCDPHRHLSTPATGQQPPTSGRENDK